MAERFVLAVVGLPELGEVIAGGAPDGVEVVNLAAGVGADRRLAERVRGATRDTLLCVVADTGDATVNRLPRRLARGGVRVLALTGLPGASGDAPGHPDVHELAAPFTVDDVLAELSSLPGDVPFLLPVPGGDRRFAAGGPPERTADLADVIVGLGEAGGAGVDQPDDDAAGAGQASARHDRVAAPARQEGGEGPARHDGADDPLGGRAGPQEAPPAGTLPAWARIPTAAWLPAGDAAPAARAVPGGNGAAPGWLPGGGAGSASGAGPGGGGPAAGWLAGGDAAGGQRLRGGSTDPRRALPDPAPGWLAGGESPLPLSDYAARALQDPPVVAGLPLPGAGTPAGRRRGQVLAVCSYKGGSGKCLTGDTLVVDPVTGVPHRLDRVVRDGAVTSVLTVDGGAVRAAPITAKVDSGVQPTLRVALRSGRSVTATPHHPFLMRDGWRRADRIVPGEAVAVPARMPLPERPRRLTRRGLARLGERVAAACARPGGTVPEAAFRLPADQLARLVGDVWTRTAGAGDGPPSLAVASHALARSLQHLLLRLGIRSDVGRTAPAGVAGTAGPWRVRVHPSGVGALGAAIGGGEPPPPGRRDAPGDLCWDEVVAVTPAGDRQVWDLSVEPTRCFVAGDVVVHNTTTALLAAGALARAVAPSGKRVALVDANTAQSSISTILRGPRRGGIVDLVRTDVDASLLAAALTPLDDVGALDVLFGAPDLRQADRRLITTTLYRRAVAGLRRTHDYVLVDTPVAEAAGRELFDDFVLRDADRLVVVVDPNRETIENNVEWLDLVGDPVSAGGRNVPPERVGIVLNRADDALDWDAEAVGGYFRRYLFLGAVPRSTAVQRAADDGRLLHAFDAGVERAVRAALSRLVDEPALDPGPATRRSALDRLLGRLLAGRAGA